MALRITRPDRCGYTDDGKAATANSFDLKTLKPLKAIPAADDADAILFDPVSGHLFVIDRSHAVACGPEWQGLMLSASDLTNGE